MHMIVCIIHLGHQQPWKYPRFVSLKHGKWDGFKRAQT